MSPSKSQALVRLLTMAEGSVIEPSLFRRGALLFRGRAGSEHSNGAVLENAVPYGGPRGSKPCPSTSESTANLTFEAQSNSRTGRRLSYRGTRVPNISCRHKFALGIGGRDQPLHGCARDLFLQSSWPWREAAHQVFSSIEAKATRQSMLSAASVS